MISKIESKMKSYIESILVKDTIDCNEYNVLNSYLAKLKADESVRIFEEGQKERSEAMKALAKIMFSDFGNDISALSI